MDNFNQYVLNESLNTAQEYFMTEDSKLPGQVYATFSLNGNIYIMALVQTKNQGVYTLEVGKTSELGGKVLWWKFHNKSDILPVLSTVVHFAEACMFMLGGKVKGIAVQFKMGASENVGRAIKIINRIIKRSFIKSFTLVDVEQPPITVDDKHYHQKFRYAFIAKKGIKPSMMFKKGFNRYDFSGAVNAVPEQVLAELKPQVPIKKTVSVKPSTKYQFKDYTLDISDPDVVDQISKATPISTVESQSEQPTKKITPTATNLAGFFMAFPAFHHMVTSVRTYGFDESKFNIQNMTNVLSHLSTDEISVLKDTFNINVTSPTPKDVTLIKDALGLIGKSVSPLSSGLKTKLFNIKKMFVSLLLNNSTKNPSTIKSTIDPSTLVTSVPGTGKVSIENGLWFEEGENVQKKVSHISNTLNYDGEYNNLPSAQQQKIKSYSGSNYPDFNIPLRRAVSALFKNDLSSVNQFDIDIDSVTSSGKRIAILAKAFDQIKPLPESIWVYRGFGVPLNSDTSFEVGEDYIDPAFMSTSVRSTMGKGNPILMRIFLPAGSKVIPILNNSYHPSENEILLPPSSVLKIIEKTEAATPYNSKKTLIQGVFMGSAHASILEALKNKLTLKEEYGMKSIQMLLREAMNSKNDNQTKHDPAEKYGGRPDIKTSNMIAKAIKDGKIKVDSSFKPKKK